MTPSWPATAAAWVSSVERDPEHRDRGDRREHVGHRVIQRPTVAEQLAILGDDEPVVVPDVETVDRRVAREGMGGQQRGERFGHPLVVAGDLERLADGVEAPHGDRVARWRARRWSRRERLAVLLDGDHVGDVGAEPAQAVGDRRRLLVERVGQRGDGVVESLEQVPVTGDERTQRVGDEHRSRPLIEDHGGAGDIGHHARRRQQRPGHRRRSVQPAPLNAWRRRLIATTTIATPASTSAVPPRNQLPIPELPVGGERPGSRRWCRRSRS